MYVQHLPALTKVGPTRDNLVIDPLSVLHLDNRLFIRGVLSLKLYMFQYYSIYFFLISAITSTQAVVEEPQDPCLPSPCGPYSNCRSSNNVAACTCQQGYVGAPPNCRPECLINADCPSSLACLQQKCQDPCPGSCGTGAVCRVISHQPVCNCQPGYSGDPYVRCSYIEPTKSSKSIPICYLQLSVLEE